MPAHKKQKLDELKSNILYWTDDEVQLLQETIKNSVVKTFMMKGWTGKV